MAGALDRRDSAAAARAGASISAITTFMPSAAKRSARARPMPLAAPVTTATRPRKSFTSASSDHAGVTQRGDGLRAQAEQRTQHLLRVLAKQPGGCGSTTG